MSEWDRLSPLDKAGEILGGICVFALPILLLFIGAAFDL